MNRCYKCKYFTTVKPFYVDPHEYCYMGYLSAFGKPELCPIQPMPTEAGTMDVLENEKELLLCKESS